MGADMDKFTYQISRQFKKCTKCAEILPVTAFNKQSKTYDGLQSQCKNCNREWRIANADYLKKSKAEYRRKNKEKINSYNRHWRMKNQELAKSYSANWVKANPDKVNAKTLRYRVWKRSNKVFFISEKFMKKLYQSECSACGSRNNIQADHIISIARGGDHSEGNLQPLCRSCNSSKRDLFYFEWKMRRNLVVLAG